MGIGDTIKGLFKSPDKGATGSPPVTQPPAATEGASTVPEPKVEPTSETTAEVTPPSATEPVNEPTAELNPQPSAETEALGTTGVNQPETSPAPNVEGAQSPPDNPEG